jgi:hypothetical protein
VTDDPLLAVAEELYAVLPGEFTAARSQHAKDARATGDKDLAARVGRLRKPSVAAWVVNALMRHQGPEMARLMEIGDALRQAQSDLDAAALRDLGRRRRQVTASMTSQGSRSATAWQDRSRAPCTPR